jgi:colicin import membrane protein
MRPADYSEEQIIEAGRALQEAGKRVTPFGIRERVGGGKPQRIREIWERYIAGEHEQSARPEQLVELPAEFEEQVQGMTTALINDLTALSKRLYARADEIAESRTREAMQAAKKAKQSAETDVVEAERLIEDQDAKIDALEAQGAALRTELDHAKREHDRLEKEKGDEIAALRVENTRLGEQVKTAQAQAAAAQDARDTAVAEREREQGAHERDRAQWEQEKEEQRATAEQERRDWTERLEQEQDLRGRLQQELERERAERKEADRRIVELRTEAATFKERAAHVEELRGLVKSLQAGQGRAGRKAAPKAASPGKGTKD